MKKHDYYIIINEEDFHVGFVVEFAGDKPGLDDRWFLPVSKKMFDELYKHFVVCTCYFELFEEVKND